MIRYLRGQTISDAALSGRTRLTASEHKGKDRMERTMYMNNALSERNLPAIPADRQEILRVLSREIYGVLPPPVPATAPW